MLISTHINNNQTVTAVEVSPKNYPSPLRSGVGVRMIVYLRSLPLPLILLLMQRQARWIYLASVPPLAHWRTCPCQSALAQMFWLLKHCTIPGLRSILSVPTWSNSWDSQPSHFPPPWSCAPSRLQHPLLPLVFHLLIATIMSSTKMFSCFAAVSVWTTSVPQIPESPSLSARILLW